MDIKTGKDSIIIGDFDEVEALKIAMKIELDGAEYYASVVGKSSDPRVIRTFKRLAEDERHHYEKFKGLFQVVLRAQGIDPATVDCEEGIFQYMDSGIFSKETEAKSVKDAVLSAQIAELRSILFYKEILKNTKHDGGRQALNEILEQEQMHFNILKSWEAAV